MHIGILQYVYASILTLLVYHELPDSPQDNIKSVMQFLRHYWKLNPTPAHFRYIHLSMFSVDPDEGYPKLKGRAAEIKHLSKGLLACWDHYRVQDPANRKYVPHLQNSLLIKKVIRMDDALYEHPPHVFPRLPDDVAQSLSTNIFDFLTILTYLADHYSTGHPLPLFSITIKCHYLMHIGIQCMWMNPRLAICYAGEYYMNYMKKAVMTTVRGNNAVQVSVKLCKKLAQWMHVRFVKSGYIAAAAVHD